MHMWLKGTLEGLSILSCLKSSYLAGLRRTKVDLVRIKPRTIYQDKCHYYQANVNPQTLLSGIPIKRQYHRSGKGMSQHCPSERSYNTLAYGYSLFRHIYNVCTYIWLRAFVAILIEGMEPS